MNIMVTGAKGFLGSKMCEYFGKMGHNIVGIDVDTIDISDPEQVAIFSKNLDIRLDGLVNNAAVSFKGKEIPDNNFVETMMVNVFGTYNITKHMVSKMNVGSSIVNVASVYGVVVPDYSIYGGNEEQYNNISYGATKAAIIQMTKIMSSQYSKLGIKVNAVSPGGILNKQDPEFIKKYSRRPVLGRMVRADEVINCVDFLLSDKSSGVIGQNIVVDAGLSIGGADVE